MFGGVNPLGERVERVIGMDRNGSVAEDRPVVDPFVGHEVDHHPSAVALASARLLPCPADGVRAR